MTTRTGWTVNGTHFAKTVARRLYSARTMYFIDGVPATQAAWVAAYKAAEAAEAADRAAVQQILDETGCAQ